MENNDNTAGELFGEELLKDNEDKKPFISEELVRKVDLQLTGLKKIIKDQADEQMGKDIKFRGNDKRVGKMISIAKLDKNAPALNIPKLPSQKRQRGAISPYTALADSDELQPYSFREIQLERKKRMFLTALRRVGGNISRACEKCGIPRINIAKWATKDELFREEMIQLSEAIVDSVEDALMERIASGDTYAITFYLKTRGKHRGYTEKIETSGTKDEFDKMTDDELLREHKRLEAKIAGREGDT